MNPEEVKQFVDLCNKVKSNNLTIPNMPKGLWNSVHSILTLPAVEVIMTRNGKDFVLNHRDDGNFKGYEIPGGFVGYKESIQDACLRIGKNEVGLLPEFKSVIHAEVWKDHPWSSALSVVCVCKVDGTPSEGDFYTDIPENMVSHHHKTFLEMFLSMQIDL